jgi:two-component system, NtrC family, response regulator AtoC
MNVGLAEMSMDVTRALEGRRAAAVARELPSHWLLESPSVSMVVASAKRIAAVATTPIIIQGERGCGVKELARVVHDEDATVRNRQFKSLPAHFVGATEMRGWAPYGTLFIEDVENLNPVGQAWVGGILTDRGSAPPALRVVVSSRFGVAELLRQRRLDQELIYLLDVSRLIIPPLRERPEEILGMARKFVGHFGARLGRPLLRFSAAAECKLMSLTYPANVCELRNIVERAVALSASDDDEIGDSAIVCYDEAGEAGARGGDLRWRPVARAAKASLLPSLAEIERDYLTMLIRELRGRRTEIARAMGVSYPTVLKKIAHHRLDVRAIVASGTEGGLAG